MVPGMDNLLMHLPVWVLVLFRLTGLFVFAPVLGSLTIPAKVKVLWAVCVAVCVYPVLLGDGATLRVVGPMVENGGVSLLKLPVVVGLELLVGMVIGYGATLPMVGLQMAGNISDQQIGTGLAGVFNPEMGEDSQGILTQFYFIVAMLFFVAMDGHRGMVAGVLQSFRDVPLGGMVVDGRLMELMVGMLTSAFEMSLRVAAPLLCLVFLETVALGFVARTVPQLNLMTIGFPLRIMAGMGVLVAAVPTHATVITGAFRQGMAAVAGYMGGAGGSAG